MNDTDPSHAVDPHSPASAAVAAVDAPQGQVAPIGYATAGLPVPYVSARPRAKVVLALSWALVTVEVLLTWPAAEGVRYWFAYSEVKWDALRDANVGMSADLAAVLLGFVFLVLYGVTTVYWLMWVHRAYRNLRALGATRLRWTPGWAVGYWFVPLFNLFRPYQVMSEAWRASDPRYERATDWRWLLAPPLLGWWWAIHLGWWFLNGLSPRLEVADGPGKQLAVACINLATLTTGVVLLLVEIRIVRELTDRQEQRAYALGFGLRSGATRGSGVLP